MLSKLFKSIIDQDTASIVICNLNCTIVYMNKSAVKIYKKDLTNTNLKLCHSEKSNLLIDEVISWFKLSHDNNIVYTYHNHSENKDIYMIALRDESGNLIGFYEKHECRNNEKMKKYNIY